MFATIYLSGLRCALVLPNATKQEIHLKTSNSARSIWCNYLHGSVDLCVLLILMIIVNVNILKVICYLGTNDYWASSKTFNMFIIYSYHQSRVILKQTGQFSSSFLICPFFTYCVCRLSPIEVEVHSFLSYCSDDMHVMYDGLLPKL